MVSSFVLDRTAKLSQLEDVCKLAYRLSGTRGMRSGVTSGRQLATRLNIYDAVVAMLKLWYKISLHFAKVPPMMPFRML